MKINSANFCHIGLAFIAALGISGASPVPPSAGDSALSERATVSLTGNRVAVVTGIIINSRIYDCFRYSGIDVASAWAGALADQWFYANTGAVQSIEILWSSNSVAGLYCGTFDAVFTLVGPGDAQHFATYIGSVVGNNKRDDVEQPARLFDPGNIDIYIEGQDLPVGHPVFGGSSPRPETAPLLTKRGFGNCQNNCGFDFTNDQTGICRDPTFPVGQTTYC